jgi:hypothetical protein
MEVLRNIFGNLASGMIRLGVAIGILAAVGYFIVRPALDTTERISREANHSFENGFKGFGKDGAGLDDINKTLREVNVTVEREIKKSFHVAKVHGVVGDPKHLIKCIRRAHGDVHKIQRCTVKF